MVIYLSAVAEELNEFRNYLAHRLSDLGYKTTWVDPKQADSPGVLTELHERLQRVECVIQIVGVYYGPAAPFAESGPDSVSFAQFESSFADNLGIKVWHVVLDEMACRDTEIDERAECTVLQKEYRRELGETGKAVAISNVEDLDDWIVETFTRKSRAPTLLAKEAPTTPAEKELRLFHDDVEFTLYRPQIAVLNRWAPWLCFAHPASRDRDQETVFHEIEEQARAILGTKFENYAEASQGAGVSLPSESVITIVPAIAGVEFQPRQRTFVWRSEVHHEQFLARLEKYTGDVVRGKITFYLGALVVAEIFVTLRVSSAEMDARQTSDTTSAYRNIFASYSSKDRLIVEHMERVVAVFGDRYLRDVRDIRAGQAWGSQLQAMIASADVFQLFWSSNSMRSTYVRQEWEFALSLSRNNFVRPTYWEEPLPEDRLNDLPPRALRSLHFERLPILSQIMTKPGRVHDTQPDVRFMPSIRREAAFMPSAPGERHAAAIVKKTTIAQGAPFSRKIGIICLVIVVLAIALALARFFH
jgi:TIR domain